MCEVVWVNNKCDQIFEEVKVIDEEWSLRES